MEPYVSLKGAILLWTTTLGKISMMDVLSRKGMYLTNICLMCYKDGESIFHFLIHCPFVMDVWHALLKDIGMSWVSLPDVVEYGACSLVVVGLERKK